MSNIINFNPSNSIVRKTLEELLKESSSIKELVVFIKTNSNDKIMYETDVSLEDKSVFVQILQHSIQEDLTEVSED